VVGAAFAVLGGLLRWRGAETAALVAWSLGGALVLGGLLIPGRLGPVYRGWMALAHAISRVTTPIVMGVLYYLVITPVGIIARALGHRPLRNRGKESYWVTRAEGARRGDLGRQF